MKDCVVELKQKIVEQFNDPEFDYSCSDRLRVALHEITDNWVTSLSYNEALGYLKDFDDEDIATLDRGQYEGTLEERGFAMLVKVLLYCLVEQELYNDEEFNALQNVEEVAGLKLN